MSEWVREGGRQGRVGVCEREGEGGSERGGGWVGV